MSWHTKYRPRAVADLQVTEVRQLLEQLMKSGQFPQVFLCAGPKGTGKTSTARIIGAMLNDSVNQVAIEQLFGTESGSKKAGKSAALVEPNPSSELSEAIFAGESFVVQELDAASNRGIDDMRQLKERVMIPPQGASVAVYILDEVHMLTTEAFNALLKLLEEPPSHAIFVLATTELHKVPSTIQSRCTILPFRRATLAELSGAVERVVQAEELKIEPAALQQVVVQADGSFRDAIKSLELLAAAAGGSPISLELAQQVLKTSFLDQIPILLQSVVGKQEHQVIQIMEELRAQGMNSTVVHRSILNFLHQDLLKSLEVVAGEPVFNKRVSHFLLQELQALSVQQMEAIPLLSLELKLLELIYRAKDRNGSEGTNSSSGSTASGSGSNGANGTKSKAPAKKAAAVEEESPTLAAAVALPELELLPVTHVDTQPLLSAWSDFVTAVEQRNTTLAALLRSAKPLIEESNGVAKVEVYYKFHRDQLMLPRFMEVLQQCAEPLLGGKPGFEFILAAPQEPIAESALM